MVEGVQTTSPRKTSRPCDARAHFGAGTEGVKGRWKVNGVRGVIFKMEDRSLDECARACLDTNSKAVWVTALVQSSHKTSIDSGCPAFSHNARTKTCQVLSPVALTAPVPTNVPATEGWVLYSRLAPEQDRCSKDFVRPATTRAVLAQTKADSSVKGDTAEVTASAGCLGGYLHRFALPRANTRGRYLKGTGLVRKDATLRGDAALCAAACLEERECEAFSVKNKKSCT